LSKEIETPIEKELRILLEQSFFDKLDDIKRFHGIRNNTEIIRYLITTTHREIYARLISK